jgi:Amt family ammonium transporter
VVYGVADKAFGFRMSLEEERRGADLSIHKIGANPEEDVRMGRT